MSFRKYSEHAEDVTQVTDKLSDKLLNCTYLLITLCNVIQVATCTQD